MTENYSDRERALLWHCRRGMKELDVILEPFMKDHYMTLPAEEKELFFKLIEQEDVDLLDWFLHRMVPEDKDLERIVNVVLATRAP